MTTLEVNFKKSEISIFILDFIESKTALIIICTIILHTFEGRTATIKLIDLCEFHIKEGNLNHKIDES